MMRSAVSHPSPEGSSRPSSGNASVRRALAVLEAVSVLQPVGLRELARSVGTPKSSVQRALDALWAGGWLVRTDEGRWSLSLRCAAVGGRAGGAETLRALARPLLEGLRQVSDESVRLWVPEGAHVVLLETLDSSQAVRSVGRRGTTMPAHATAAGKAVLAALPEDEAAALLAGPLEALTAHTVTDPARLRAELVEARRRGWAETRNEAHLDVGAVAAAVTAPGGRPLAAIALALPMHRLTDGISHRYGQAARSAARALGARLAGEAAGDGGP